MPIAIKIILTQLVFWRFAEVIGWLSVTFYKDTFG